MVPSLWPKSLKKTTKNKNKKTWIFLAIISHFIPLINKQINNMQNLTNNFSENFYFTRCITKLGDEFRYLLGPIWVFFLLKLFIYLYLLLLSFLGGLFNSSGNCLSAFSQHNSVALLYFKNLSIYIICAVKFIIQFNSI